MFIYFLQNTGLKYGGLICAGNTSNPWFEQNLIALLHCRLYCDGYVTSFMAIASSRGHLDNPFIDRHLCQY